MDLPVWVLKSVVLALHEEQLTEHGGSPGLRDEGLLDSALARPQNLLAYGNPDIADMAAAYAYGIARNHAFIDGNKRASLVVTELFLDLNGFSLQMTDAEAVLQWLALGEGTVTEEAMAAWIRARLSPGI
ncbi:MAG: type II toxin-antitoxin system death-on-curing family toxin [Phreatobacter sp.]|uniref:type II toxin-antitoxin system death-on-curing family toxin n=1 Tax=Phreatobacter sp. TaxID=1966341 RepID=UPI001A575190|nr:type II toxin-antitoxin system death-on-curing family toxin [Phreatobacter sp.]MBL8570202.1 type II toxin-antitoxin system death-on-curing family toxin [Phreatobacter sp.]